MTTDAAAGPRPYLGPVTLLTLTQMMISWAVFSPPVAAKQAMPELGLAPIWIGAQPTIMFIAAMVAGVLTSSWVARVNPMRATQLFVFLCVIGMALIGSGSVLLGILGSAAIGAALGPSTPASSHILGRVTPPHLQPLIFSIRQTGVPMGGILAGFITPLLVQHWHWQVAMFVVAAGCLAAVALVEPWVRGYAVHADPSIERRSAILAPVRLIFSIPSVRWLGFAIVPLVTTQYVLTTFLVLYLQEDIGLSVITAGWVLGTAQASGGVGRILFGLIAGRYLPPLTVLLGLSVATALASGATATVTASWPLALIYLLGVAFGATAAGWNGVFIAEAARQAPAGMVSRVVGGLTFIIFGAIVLGPPGFAYLIEQAGFTAAFIVSAGLMVFGVFAFLKARTVTEPARRGPA